MIENQPSLLDEAAPAIKPYPTIHEALAAKFCQPHYITLFEVRDSTGFDSSRSADAISIGMYRSRGRELTGFEIKVSRSDWLRELKHPEKAEEIGKFCDWFYLVTNDEAVAKIEEIPGPWGWMVLKGSRFKIAKKPEKLNPLPLDRHMLCSLLYSTRGQALMEVKQQIEKQVADGIAASHNHLTFRADQAEQKFKELQKAMREFEEASGVAISSGWHDRPKIGAAVRRILDKDSGLKKYRDEIEWVARRARALTEQVERELAELAKEEGA